MRLKSKSGSETEKQYQFETALPIDEAMQRLHDQMGHVHIDLFPIKRYKISSEKLRDSIHFEIVRRPSRFSHHLVIIGTIREIDQNRTVLECQVKGNNPKRHAALAALPLFLTLLIVAAYRSDLQPPELLLFSLVGTAVLLIATAPKRFPELGADDIERIEKAVGYRESLNTMNGEITQKPLAD